MTTGKLEIGTLVRIVSKGGGFEGDEGVIASIDPKINGYDYGVAFGPYDGDGYGFNRDEFIIVPDEVPEDLSDFERTEVIEEGVTMWDTRAIVRKYGDGFEFDQPTTHTRKVITYVGPWEAK